MHWFCRACLLDALPERASAAKCPTCSRFMNVGPLRALVPADEQEDSGGAAAPLAPAKPPKAKSAKKAKPKARRRAASSEEDDSDDDDDDDYDVGALVAPRTDRPRRNIVSTAKARAAAADDDDSAASAEEDATSASDEDAAPAKAAAAAKAAAKGKAVVALSNPAPPSSAAIKGKGKGKAPKGPVVVQSESKLQMLLGELKKMRDTDESSKGAALPAPRCSPLVVLRFSLSPLCWRCAALIFTQFASTLEWLQTRLVENGFSYRSISGSMPLNKRAKAIDAFQKV